MRHERTSASVDLTTVTGPLSTSLTLFRSRIVNPVDVERTDFDAAWESEGKWRFGVAWYYTGAQRLDANPYRKESAPSKLFGVLVSRRIGSVLLFLNGENLLNVKHTDWDPLQRPTRGVDGRWTVDAWAPLDGRVLNGGKRVAF